MPCKKTSSFIEGWASGRGAQLASRSPQRDRSLRERTRRVGKRGAVFLEAIIVISTLTLGLIALAYVRDLYVRQLDVARLTRAAVIAHSMAGCKTNQARDWLGKDLGEYSVEGTNQDSQSARGKDAADAPTTGNSSKANNLVQRSGSTSSDGKGLLNPITDAQFAGQAKATAKDGGRGGLTRTVFSGRVRAQSFVSCGDEVKDGDFDRVLGVMKDEISNLLGK